MNNNDEASVYIYITNFESVEEALELNLIKGSRMTLKGEAKDVRRPQIKAKYNSWVLKSALLPELKEDDYWLDICINSNIEKLLEMVEPYKGVIANLANKYFGELSIGIYNYDMRPGIHIDKLILKQISDLNLEIDIDIYCFGEKDEE